MTNPYSYTLRTDINKSTKAVESMRRAVMELIKKKAPDEIDVKELCDHARVSRNTFYHYYHNLRELIDEQEDILLDDLFRLNEPVTTTFGDRNDYREMVSGTVEYISRNWDYFYTLLILRQDERFMRRWKEGHSYQIYERLIRAGLTSCEIWVDIVTSAWIAGNVFMVQNPGTVTLDEACTITEKILNNVWK